MVLNHVVAGLHLLWATLFGCYVRPRGAILGPLIAKIFWYWSFQTLPGSLSGHQVKRQADSIFKARSLGGTECAKTWAVL